MRAPLGELLARDHRPHALHGDDRVWPETNCYVDLWIEVLHALGHDPHAMLGCALASSFEGDQWLFFKPAASDLYALYGIDLQELTVYRPLTAHAAQQLAAGRLLLVEVDAYYLPDTRGVSYRTQHKKTTIAIARIDLSGRTLSYFHNAGYFTLDEPDFEALLGSFELAGGLPPYTEFVRLGMGPALSGRALAERARALLGTHLARAPRENPIARYRHHISADLEALRSQPGEAFHEYAFATLRQLGAAFELSAAYLGWLGEHGAVEVLPARAPCALLANHAKTLQFKAARAVMRGRAGELDGLLGEMEAAWHDAYGTLRRVCP